MANKSVKKRPAPKQFKKEKADLAAHLDSLKLKWTMFVPPHDGEWEVGFAKRVPRKLPKTWAGHPVKGVAGVNIEPQS